MVRADLRYLHSVTIFYALQELLQTCIDLSPRAIWLAFGEVEPLAKPVKAAGITLIVQVQFLDDVEPALRAGADIIVGQVDQSSKLTSQDYEAFALRLH